MRCDVASRGIASHRSDAPRCGAMRCYAMRCDATSVVSEVRREGLESEYKKSGRRSVAPSHFVAWHRMASHRSDAPRCDAMRRDEMVCDVSCFGGATRCDVMRCYSQFYFQATVLCSPQTHPSSALTEKTRNAIHKLIFMIQRI